MGTIIAHTAFCRMTADLRRRLLEHRDTYEPGSVRDFTDCLLEANTNEVFPSVNGKLGVVLAPNQFTVKFTPRK